MIIRIKQEDLTKFPKPIYETVVDEGSGEEMQVISQQPAYSIILLLQDRGYKGCTYDVIGKIVGDTGKFISDAKVTYRRFELSDDIPKVLHKKQRHKFSLINTPGNIRCKKIRDIVYVHENIDKLSKDDLDNIDTIYEFRNAVKIVDLTAMVLELKEQIDEGVL